MLLLYIFLLLAVFQLLIWLVLFGQFAFRQKTDLISGKPASIIIAARNESENLQKNLKYALEQDHPEFEVIVVDDCSWDNTGEILKDFARQYHHLKIVKVEETDKFFGGKKFAVTMGVKAAKNDLIVLTDADCRAASDKWLGRMCGSFGNNKDIVLGYGAYKKEKGLINALVRFDTFLIALLYYSMAILIKPYMGVGRNLAWKKDLFMRNKGFATHTHLSSGDDDLFINEVGKKHNTAICDHPEAHTISTLPSGFSAWLKQKSRHLTTWSHYRFQDKMILGFINLTTYLFILFFVILLIMHTGIYLILIIFACRFLVQLFVFYKAMKKFNCSDLILAGFALEIIMLLLYPLFIISSTISGRRKWMK